METRKFKGDDAYPVFVMLEQMNINGLIDWDEPLDTIWESCVYEYARFERGAFNDTGRSEYDCISDYVRNIADSKPKSIFDFLWKRLPKY